MLPKLLTCNTTDIKIDTLAPELESLHSQHLDTIKLFPISYKYKKLSCLCPGFFGSYQLCKECKMLSGSFKTDILCNTLIFLMLSLKNNNLLSP